MDEENKFQTHAEKEFWERVVVGSTTWGDKLDAVEFADTAVLARRERLQVLIKPGVKVA
jgi:hypothetical protein